MEDDELLGDVTLSRHGDNVQAELVLRPAASQFAVSFIGAALSLSAWPLVRALSCRVREYEAETADILASAGFQVTQRDVLLVRPTMAKVKAMGRFAGPLFEGSLRVPRGTPTLSTQDGGGRRAII